MSLDNVAGNPADEGTDSRLSLREQLEQQFTAAEAAPEPAPEPVETPEPATPAAPAAAATAADRARGPDGKFVEKPKTEAAPAKAAPVATASPAQPGQPSAKRTAPQSWSADKHAAFETLPPDVQEYILKREDEQITGVKKLKESYESRFGELAPLAEIVNEVAPRLRATGTPTGTYFRNLAAADKALIENGPRAIVEIARMYGIDLGSVAQQMSGGQGQPQQPDLTHVIQQHIAPIAQRLQSWEQQQHQAKLDTATQAIEAFASDPANSLYGEVERDMVERLPLIQRRMPNASYADQLKAAYEDAVYANPATRAKALASQQASTEAARRETAKATVAKARGAAVSVTGSPGVAVSAAAAKPRSLREELEANFSELRA